jgi:myo-inositol-1(or 4)-monophosphatase
VKDSEIDERYEAAELAVREAGALALRLREEPEALGIEQKGLLDFATEADRAAERLIIERLGRRFGDGVLGEEYGGGASERLWVVDPIDGTYNYIHGLPYWCVSLAFVAGGEILIGMVFNPMRDEFFSARRGYGAFLNGRPLSVSGAEHLARPLVEAGASNRRPAAEYVALVSRLIEHGCEFRRLGSGALGLASVAAGQTDAYCELHINAWDVLAGILLVREAGGWTNDFLKDDGLNRGNPILACTPAMRDRLVAATGIA